MNDVIVLIVVSKVPPIYVTNMQERQWRGGVNKWRQEHDKKDIADHPMHTTKGGSTMHVYVCSIF